MTLVMNTEGGRALRREGLEQGRMSDNSKVL